jgi:predicted DNA-binding transcriptional regulator AlpA
VIDPSDRLLDEDQAAEYLHTSPRKMQRWRAEGDGPAYVRLGKRDVRYWQSTLREYASARTYRSRAAELAAA